MVNRIGNAGSVLAVTTRPAPGGAQAQLAKLQADLSDWVHCASCHTPQGQAKIADITAKIQDLEKSVADAATARQSARELAQQGAQRSSATDAITGAQILGAQAASPSDLRVSSPIISALGQNVDVFV